MAGRKSAGVAPLGYSPMLQERLEGPKKHHDNHGSKDSVPGKHPIGEKAWEVHYNATDASKNMHYVEGADFVPKCPGDRKTTYIKVNREDH